MVVDVGKHEDVLRHVQVRHRADPVTYVLLSDFLTMQGLSG